MGTHTYVARKYDVEFLGIDLSFKDFYDMFYDLVDLSQDENLDLPEITYCTDDYNNWYEIDKKPLEGLVAYLKTLDKANDVLVDDKSQPVCPAKYIDMLEELLAPVGKDLEFVRVEFD